MNFSSEMIEKAKSASSAEELIRMAAEEGVELTAEEADRYCGFLHGSRPLSDEEIELVAGGKGDDRTPRYKAGQRVVFWDSHGESHYGTIESSGWVEFQKAYYYWVQMDEGGKMKFPLESDACPAKVIS